MGVGWQRIFGGFLVLLLLALFLPLPGVGQGKLRAAFVYVGPVGDAGWTYAHDQGRRCAEKQVKGVETTYVENVSEADAERVIVDLARRGYKVIFTTSYGYMDATIAAARRFPNTIFEHASGFKRAKNVGTYFGRIEQARYLTGLVAGKMTKTHLIGYVAAHPIPEVVRGINSFTLGVRAVNPKAKVHVVWTNTWYDPGTEREAAESLLNLGADVLAQHQDSPAAVQAASKRGKYAIGYHSDMSKFGGRNHLTAAVWNWCPLYVYILEHVRAGTWKSEDLWWGMGRGVVDIAPFSPLVPASVRQLVEARRKAIVQGKFDIFAGPIKDQEGRVRIPQGSRLSDEQQLSMDWFVEGVVGQIPKK
ncbi:MAG: BMP family ABC transporter substrate-binding protein [Armatimonadota bacterium]|nr:BMP family ABC transporter substrate-binding protein [Armatimonadota bacterium]MDR5701992.1 BMP family ABC transporter substrate-binding protein [Armatimonadota bacterium]